MFAGPVVGAEHVVTMVEQALAQVRAEETGPAGDEDALAGAAGSHRLSACLLLPFLEQTPLWA